MTVYHGGKVHVHAGDCLEVMAGLEAESEPLPLFAPVWQRIAERHDAKPYGPEEAHQNGVGCYEVWMGAKRREIEGCP